MLAPTREPLPYTVYRTSRWASGGSDPGAWRRVRRVALVAALLSLIPALVSFASMMVQPSNASFFINAVEWLRDNGARGLVNTVENYYYSLTAPAKGGPALHALPQPAVTLPSRGAEEVPVSQRSKLVATFNSGFKLSDDAGGFAYGGRTYAPLRDGMATIAGYKSGRVNVISWTSGPDAPTNVVW